MCGITGIINTKGIQQEESLRKMTQAILHRGPDDDGFLVDGNVALGMRRLSIIDLAGGKQPLTTSDGRFTIFFNGEIYNYKELREELVGKDYKFETQSDTEVVLMMYKAYGRESLVRLRGMFVFSIYDKEKQEVFLARDFFGIKPLYYLKDFDSVTAFSSEIKSFLVLPEFKALVNDKAVFNYLSFQYNPLEETFFKGVYKLPPAHFMTIDALTGQAKVEKYWQFTFKPDSTLDEKKTAQKILETMEDSVAHHMIADVPVGSFLSGGIDSSIIATLMQKIRGEKKIKTFTVGFETLSEGVEAKETSGPLGTDHKEITVGRDEYFSSLEKAVWHFDEPVADPSALGLYFLAREARKEVKVVLSGEGSDELFGGYNIYLEPYARRKIAWIPQFVLKMILALPFEFRGKNYAERASRKLEDWYIGNASIFKEEEVKELWTVNDEERVSLRNIYKEVENFSDPVRMQYVDVHTWLVGDILAKADKMTMAHSLELRVPFLDMEVVKLAETLPDRFKWSGRATKYLLREAFKTVLPESVRKRKKLGFPTPVRDWFDRERTDVYKTIRENEYIKSHLNGEVIERIIEEHVSKKRDNSRKIYLLLVFAIWYNTFIKLEKS
ncbi:MAG: asparagine synthase (glutamine-hydrolyzing) [Parcubacteria group bacterium]